MMRRDFLFVSSGATIGTLLVPGIGEAQDGPSTLHPESGLITGIPKPLRHAEIPGFLSASQIAPHHTSHYGGALKAFVGVEDRFDESIAKGQPIETAAFETMKRLQSSRGNSVLLHELYFDGMTPKADDPSPGIRKAIEKRFGSLDKWAADFVSSAKAAAGWAVLVIHPINGRLYNVVSDEHAQGPLWLSTPLVIIDTYEHAYYIDYQSRKSDYIETFLRFVDWTEAERRYQLVVK